MDLLKILRENREYLCTGMFSDVLDEMGYRGQIACLPCINLQQAFFIGPARTVYLTDTEDADERIHVGLGYLAECTRGDVLMVQGSESFAYFGELMATVSLKHQLEGAVVDGLTRDTRATFGMSLPIVASGYSPVDIKGRGKVDAVNTEIEIGGIGVRPGDIVAGDGDGVAIIPLGIFFDVAARVVKMKDDELVIKERIAKGENIEQILTHHKSF